MVRYGIPSSGLKARLPTIVLVTYAIEVRPVVIGMRVCLVHNHASATTRLDDAGRDLTDSDGFHTGKWPVHRRSVIRQLTSTYSYELQHCHSGQNSLAGHTGTVSGITTWWYCIAVILPCLPVQGLGRNYPRPARVPGTLLYCATTCTQAWNGNSMAYLDNFGHQLPSTTVLSEIVGSRLQILMRNATVALSEHYAHLQHWRPSSSVTDKSAGFEPMKASICWHKDAAG